MCFAPQLDFLKKKVFSKKGEVANWIECFQEVKQEADRGLVYRFI